MTKILRSTLKIYIPLWFLRLTGNEGGRMICLGEQLNVPTAMRAFTGIVNI